ncbi:MAG TPA: amino acid ABC transporter permease [bacterium]|nr:amino acid ABC transporter permease [bacterium]
MTLWPQIAPALPQLLRGLRTTLEISGIVLVAGSVVGVVVGLLLLYGGLIPRLAARAFVDTVRGIPVLVLIFACYFGLPALGLSLSAWQAGVTALSIFAAAHIAEIVRGGIDSIPRAQMDAAKAIGLSFWPRLCLVILPQATRRMLPPWVNAAVEIVKGSALLSLLGIVDLLLAMQNVVGYTFIVLPFYVLTAVFYFAVNFTISRAAALLERRYAYLRY